MKIESNQKISFKAGLNTKILLKEKFINPQKQEQFLLQNFGINADFKENKSIALANRLCAEIFNNIAQKFNMKINFPPFITVYERKVINKDADYVNFCLTDTKSVIKGDNPFPGRSIFFKNYKSLKQVDKITQDLFESKKTSTDHFLSPFIHEWLHCLHLNYLYEKYGYPGNCEYMKSLYPLKDKKHNAFDLFEKTLSPDENQIVTKNLGSYSAKPQNQYMEVFSETFTKLICDSLSKDCTHLDKNPAKLLENTSDEFQNIVSKVISG